MDQQESVILVAVTSGSPAEEACHVFFYGDYQYCGEAGGGYVLCCLGELH